MAEQFEVVFPEHFDLDASLIEAKGSFSGVEVRTGNLVWRPVFFDPVRLQQEVADALDSDGYFQEPTLIVVTKITRAEIEAAVQRIMDRSPSADPL
jgi:hypothetical protein